MTRFTGILLWAILTATFCQAAEIVLVYPRVEITGNPHSYAMNVDSTFVLGHVNPVEGDLTVNGFPVKLDEYGAFLAWLPLRRGAGQRSWDLVLRQGKKQTASLSFGYGVETDSASSEVSDTIKNPGFPRVVRVIQSKAHTRTAAAGTYDLFPDVGCKLLAMGRDRGSYSVRLCEGWFEEIERESVALESDTSLAPVVLGNGTCERLRNRTVCKFALGRPVAWSSSLTSDMRSLIVTLFGAVLGTDRLRYDVADSLLHDVARHQLPDRVELKIRCNRELARGYSVMYRNDSLQIQIAAPYPSNERRLRGKVIVLDPGHGGKHTGAIGPLGTEEKDVVLTWAQILKMQLRDEGATVVLTRELDQDMSLYDRTESARKANADFFLSLHCNALPDTENPFLRHGVGTYFFQSASRAAAELIYRQLLTASNLRDDGLFDANLAVVRPTDFPAVLVEAAYLIYPPEERLLQSSEFLRTVSGGIVRGLKDYFERVP